MIKDCISSIRSELMENIFDTCLRPTAVDRQTHDHSDLNQNQKLLLLVLLLYL